GVGQAIAEHRRARARDRTGFAAESVADDAPVGYAQIDAQCIAAKRIGAIRGVRAFGERAESTRRATVFEHELLIQERNGHAAILVQVAGESGSLWSCVKELVLPEEFRTGVEAMAATINRQFRLAARPVGLPK